MYLLIVGYIRELYLSRSTLTIQSSLIYAVLKTKITIHHTSIHCIVAIIGHVYAHAPEPKLILFVIAGTMTFLHTFAEIMSMMKILNMYDLECRFNNNSQQMLFLSLFL